MKFCQPHWDICRQTVEAYGMVGLVAKSGGEAVDCMKEDIESCGKSSDENFDPLMSLHWHFINDALRCGGLYLLGANPSGNNAGHYCPICEFEKNMEGFDARQAVETIAKQIAAYCREKGLLTKVQ